VPTVSPGTSVVCQRCCSSCASAAQGRRRRRGSGWSRRWRLCGVPPGCAWWASNMRTTDIFAWKGGLTASHTSWQETQSTLPRRCPGRPHSCAGREGVLHSPVQCIVQCSIVKHSTVQYSTGVLHCTAQCILRHVEVSGRGQKSAVVPVVWPHCTDAVPVVCLACAAFRRPRTFTLRMGKRPAGFFFPDSDRLRRRIAERYKGLVSTPKTS